MSKTSYATYVKDRLAGFSGESVVNYYFADLADYPLSTELVAANPGRRKRSAPACNARISVKDDTAIGQDMLNLKQADVGADVAGIFSSAASPGVVSIFFRNEHYGSDEEYVFAIAEGMRADFIVLEENPLESIANSRDIFAVYRDGSAIDRDSLREDWIGGR